MKRKLLATLLALCLIVGMIPVAASAAEETVNTAAELTDALANAIDGDTIRLGDDIVLDPTYAIKNDEYTEEEKEDGPPIPYFTIDHSIVLDLNGHTISWDVEKVTTNSQDIWYTLLLFAVDGAEVTICGNGTIETEANYSNSYGINIVNNGSLTIENGTFTGATSAIQVQTGSLVITGGTFKQAKTIGSVASQYAKYVVNAIDANYKNGTAKIALKGGEYCYDYSNFPEGTNTTYVADGYVMETSSGETGMYTVSPKTEKTDNDVAVVDGQYFTQLQNAINAAERGETVALLKDTTENVTIASGKDLQLDLNGKTLTETTYMDVQGVLTIKDSTATSAPQISSDYETVTYQSGKIANTGTGILVSNGGKLTLESGCVHSTSGNGINVNGNTNMEGWDNAIDSSVTITGGYVHSREYGIGVYGNGAVVNVEGGVVVADDNGAIAGNGSYNSDSNGDGVKDNYGGTEINIRGGTVIGHIVSSGYIAVGIYHPQNGELNISGGTIYADNGVGICIRNGSLNISENAQLYASGNEAGKVGDAANEIPGKTVVIDYSTGYNHGNETTDSRTVTIEGGYFSAEQNNIEVYTTEDNKIIDNFITGGYFTSDPSAYLAENMAAVQSDKEGYTYMVAEAGENPAEVVPADPSVDTNLNVSDKDEKELLDSIKTSLGATGDGSTPPSLDADSLNAAALTEANKNTTKVNDELVKELKEAIGEGTDLSINDVTIVIQPYMDIKVTYVNSDGDQKSFTLDITPMYRKVAVKNDDGNVPDDIVTKEDAEGEGGSRVNAVVLENAVELPVKQPTEVVIPLPTGFTTGKTLYVLHDNRHYHQGAVESDVLTFTTEGFSPFTISTSAEMAAQIGDVYYGSLQDAVDNVQNGETVVLLKDQESATVDREVSFTISSQSGSSFTAAISAGAGYRNVGADNSYRFERIPSTPVNPGGDDDKPEEPAFPFTDVKSTAWYYNAVKYVYENNLMAGTGDTTFDPEVSLTRAMTAQILYNLEGQPKVDEEATFADMNEAPTWSVGAIAWAQDTGVVAGMGDNEFAPNAKVTREQFAQMLYNYAKYKGYDLTATGDLTQFPDAGSISGWAETALSWANGKGLINGHENGTIDPKGSTIRAQAASIMANFDQNVAK